LFKTLDGIRYQCGTLGLHVAEYTSASEIGKAINYIKDMDVET
jgi:hypothetical protein